MLDAIYPDKRVRARERMSAVHSYLTLPIGQFLTILGFILSTVGGMCIDETLVGVEDCRGLGVALLSLGPALFVFGLFLIVYTCEWVLIKSEGQEPRRGTTEEIQATIEKSVKEQTVEKGNKMISFGATLMTLAAAVHGVRIYQRGPTTVKEPWAIAATILATFGLLVFSFGLALVLNTAEFEKNDLSQSKWRKNRKGTQLGATSSQNDGEASTVALSSPPPKPVGKAGANVLASMGLGKGNRRTRPPVDQSPGGGR